MKHVTRTSSDKNLNGLARFCLMFSVMLASTSLYASWDKQTIRDMVVDEAGRQNLSVALALAVAETESNFDPYARSHVDARGVMQILPKTAEEDLGVRASSLYNPRVNIRAGVRFLIHLLTVYDGRVDIALSHYNGGSRVRQKDGSLQVIPATRNYVEKVLSKARRYGFDGRAISETPQPANLLLAQREALDDFEQGDPLVRNGSFNQRSANQGGLANQTLNAIKQGETDSKAEVINKLKNLVIYNQNRVLKGSMHDRGSRFPDQDRQIELANEW
jgi:hypothetical protein